MGFARTFVYRMTRGQLSVKLAHVTMAHFLGSCDNCTNQDSARRIELDRSRYGEGNGLHRNTITNIEIGRYAGNHESMELIEEVLHRVGIEFLPDNGVRLRVE